MGAFKEMDIERTENRDRICRAISSIFSVIEELERNERLASTEYHERTVKKVTVDGRSIKVDHFPSYYSIDSEASE